MGDSPGQSRMESLVESGINILIGFAVALASQIIVFPIVGIHGVSLATNLEIGAYFTAISLARSYVIRRWFNARLHSTASSIARRME